MTVVNPDSIAGITSVTSSGTTLEFYDVNGNLLDVSANLTGELTVGTGATISSPGASIIDFETNGSERLRIGSSGQIGIAGANYGTSGQVLTSAGSGSAVSWTTIPAQATIANNADNRIITGGSGVNLNGEVNLTWDGTDVKVTSSGQPTVKVGSTNAGGAAIYLDGDSDGDWAGNDYSWIRHTTGGDLEYVVDNPASAGNHIFKTGGSSERLRIDSDGAVNIGSNPAQATGTNTQNAILTVKGYPGGNESSAAILALIRGYNTTSAAANHTIGRIVFGDKQAGEYAFIEGEAEANGAVNDTPGRLVFSTAPDGTSAPTEKLRIDSSGRVLIGTTTEGNASADDLTVATSGTTGITIRSGTSNTGNIYFSDATSGTAEFAGAIEYAHNGNSLRLHTNSDERLRIDSAGRVLIGHTSSTVGGRLELQRASAETWMTINESSDSGSGPALYINRTRGSNLASPGPIEDGNYMGSIHFGSYDTNSYEKGASIQARADGQTWANGDCPTRLSLWTTRDGETNPREWMRISNDGCLTFARGGNTQIHNPAHVNGKHRYSFDYSTDDSTIPFRGMRVYGSYGIGGGSTDYSYAALFDGGKTHNNCQNQYITFNQITQQLVASTHGIYCENSSSYSASYCYEGKMMKNLGAYTDAYTYHSNIVTSNSGGTAYHYYATDNGTLKFRVYQNGNAQNANNSWGSTSDVKLKENIVDAGSQWEDIKAVKVRNFNFKASTGQDTSKHIGVIAQEIETISPGLVHTDNDTTIDEATGEGTVTGTTKSVKYSILYMKAIKALQEAMTKIETLESKVESIQAQQANDAAYEAKIDKIIDYFKL